jgi:tripartite ATP-independent transporter DctM subunit
MGATTGIVGATIVTLGLLTLPTLLRRGYDKSLACGAICASGTLGQLIPPSTILILLADIMGQSVGTLFAAAMLPGLMLAGIFCIYFLVLGMVRPDMAPPVPLEERQAVSSRELLIKVLKVGLPPIALVLAVLGSIIGGIAAPTEAASMGALGSILVAMSLRRFDLKTLREVIYSTGRITAAMMFVLVCAQVFALAFRGLQGEQLVHDAFAMVPGGVNGMIFFMLLLIFVLGFFIEWIEISYIVVPMFLPLLNAAGVDPVWIATLIAVNLQTSFLTPPFGWALFYLRSVAPPNVATTDIYKGVVPFILLQLCALAIVFFYPGIATWLPKAIGW